MASADLPNLGAVTDQLRVDNAAVGAQSETFLVGNSPAPAPADSSSTPDPEAGPSTAKSDVFPFMRAYGCLGRKKDGQQ